MIDKLLLLQKEIRNLGESERLVITAPRRAGKTILLRNIVASYYDNYGYNRRNILFIAPQKRYKILDLPVVSTAHQFSTSCRVIPISLVIVEEAAYCDNKLLELMDDTLNCKKIFVTTPKPVEYTWAPELNDWVCETYVKRLVDQNSARVFSFYHKDFDKEMQELREREKGTWTKKQWDCEIDGKWVE